MRSATTLDPRASDVERPEVRDLLVLWQHPETRGIIPIGRFAHAGDGYSFAYTRAAATVGDFRPLPGLEDLHRRHVSDRLPPVFGQRVMEPDRPDYVEYLHTLGHVPSQATPWEQIVHSGGARAGDTLQFMPVPRVTDGRAFSASIRELMAFEPAILTVVRLGEPDTPPHLRLVLDLDMAAPPGFQFDRDGLWEPLPAQ